jgi:hypothetical protein
MPKFEVGERVKRIENREITGAIVLEITELESDEPIYYIKYDEGPGIGHDGTGWWSENNLEKE